MPPEPQFLSAADSCPIKMGWMVGSPPPADKLVRYADMGHYTFPKTRWSFSNFRSLVPTRNVARGTGPVAALARAERGDIDALAFTSPATGQKLSWAQSLQASYTDAIAVLHRGRIVCERYFGVMTPSQPHMAMSVTKSLIGTLGALLVEEGALDANAQVAQYLPELAGTAYDDATVRQLLDMTIGVRFSELYADPQAEVWQHLRAGGVFPRPPGYAGPQGFCEFLTTLRKEGEHAEAFAYKTVNSDVLGWLIGRVTGQSVSDLLSQRIWSRLGVEQDAYMLIDSTGTEFAGGGFNPTLRDLARFGEMMRLDGQFNGQQILPKAVIDDIRGGARPADFAQNEHAALMPGGSYRNMWWVTHNEHGAFMARGVHGQALYIDPRAEMVIARFASFPVAVSPVLIGNTMAGFHALARHLLN